MFKSKISERRKLPLYMQKREYHLINIRKNMAKIYSLMSALRPETFNKLFLYKVMGIINQDWGFGASCKLIAACGVHLITLTDTKILIVL
jgi:hypothetical protein